MLPRGIAPLTLISPPSHPKLCLNPRGLEAFRGSPHLSLVQSWQQGAGDGAAEEQPLCSSGPLVNWLVVVLSSVYFWKIRG